MVHAQIALTFAVRMWHNAVVFVPDTSRVIV